MRVSRSTTRILSTVVTVALLLAVWWLQSRGSDDPPEQERPVRDETAGACVDLADLPPEAAETVDLIEDGGPYPYPGKDGSTFGNYEGELPDRERGYYAEYTVDTPGLSHRGPRRIVAGDGGELYWTADHYASFESICPVGGR